MTRIVIADDQQLVRGGLKLMFDPEPDLEVVGEAADGREAVALCQSLNPDVAILDIRMPGMDGIQAAGQLLGRTPPSRTRVLILTTFDDDDYVHHALKAGASGFLLKDAPAERIVAGVRTVAQGDALLAPTVTRRLIERYTAQVRADPGQPLPWGELTERELEVLQLIAQGLANSEIAERLNLGAATVKSHVSHILMKLELRDRVQAVVFAYESGLLDSAPGLS
ncbi:MAG: response regulator [Candidatus Dormibacteria bacterium]